MADNTVTDLADLGALAGGAPAAAAPEGGAPEAPVRTGPAAPLREKEVDAQGRSYATGKRKDAVARVWVKPGSGKITINGKSFEAYFARPVLQMILQQPIVAAARDGQFDIDATVAGGGLSGQAGAVRHGISKALTYF